MSWALDLVVKHFAFGEGSLCMAAAIGDRMDAVLQPK
jgi:thiamine pyrophosphokinase